VYGKNIEEKKELYKNINADKFAERDSYESGGDYVLVDTRQKEDIIISSPGFSSGYIHKEKKTIVTTSLGSLVKILKEKGKCEIVYDRLRSLLNNGTAERPGALSIFKNVVRLTPSSFMKIKKIHSYEYIRPKKKLKSCGRAIESAINKLRSVSNDFILMYSGGLDSTSLAIAMKEIIGSDSVNPITIDIPQRTNSPERAEYIGKKYNIDTTVLNYSWPPDDKKVIDDIVKGMKKDMVNQNSPHWKIVSEYDEELIVSGQNMDTVLTDGMSELVPSSGIKRNIRVLAKNMLFTDLYEKSEMLQNIIPISLKLVALKYYDVVFGKKGLYVGLIKQGSTALAS
jgi:hypothetical protein